MKDSLYAMLVCPQCHGNLAITVTERLADTSIETGTYRCEHCDAEYPILRGVPRFVPLQNYASNFGFEWSVHARTQYDSYSGAPVSETRFFEETAWPRDLRGETILEVGSGSGRFTEQAACTGANVISIDYSFAVDANQASNGGRENVLIVQADIYALPFRDGAFDKVFCIGVLQHTPDPEESFLALPRFLKQGGSLVVDVYRKHPWWRHLVTTKYWLRPLTSSIPPERLYACASAYVTFMWPLARLLHRLPCGRSLNWALLIADYRGVYPLAEDILLEWAILDTFDMLSPRYDFPQTLATVRGWFEEASLTDIDVLYGYNGIMGRGRRGGGEGDSGRGGERR